MEPGKELSVREAGGRFCCDPPGAALTLVRLPDTSLQMLPHRARADQDEVILDWQAQRHPIEKPLAVLEAVWLAGGLGHPTPTVTEPRIVPDMPGRSVMRRNVGLDPLEPRRPVVGAGDDRLARVDPHERHV